MQKLQLIDLDRTCGTFYLYALTCQLIQLFAVDFDCRIHRRQLHLLAGKLRQHRFQLLFAEGRHRHRFDNLTAVIAGNGLRSQRKFGNIFLAAFYSKFQQTGCTARKNRKNSCRVRVKSSPMSDFLCVKHAPQKADNIVRCHLWWF